MKPIFCGNFDFEARSSDLERLFRRYGKVDRVDMKSGFAFIYMDDERDADYAIRALDRTEFGRKGRRLRVEWTKHDQVGRKPVSSRKSANLRPSKTLFVINFPHDTQTRDLERHFEPYGKINNVRIRKNFAFVEYESLDDAIRALEATNLSKFMDRVITVEYSNRGGEDNNRKNGYSPDRRDRDRSPDRRRRSPSPYRRPRRSPDYGTGSSPLAHRRERGSPVYGNGSSRSPRRVERASPVYNRKRSTSPRHDERSSPEFRGRGRGRDPEIRGHGRSRSRSPRRDVRASPEFRGRDHDREILDRGRSRSCSPHGGQRNENGYPRQPSLSGSEREEGAILDDDPEPLSPPRKSDSRDRPIVGSRSPIDKRHSRSPLALEQSPS